MTGFRRIRDAAIAALVPVVVVLAIPGAEAQDYRAVFEAERSLLETERDALRRELSAVRERGELEGASVVAELAAFRDLLDALRARSGTLETRIADRDRALDAGGVRRDLLAATLNHAEELLRAHGVLPLTDEAGVGIRIGHIFDEGCAAVERRGSVHVAPGDFFTRDGRRSTGSIVHVGAVAALGVSDVAAGVLAPAGEDALIVIDDDPADVIRSFVAGGDVEFVPLYLTDPLRPDVAIRPGFSLREFLASGGVIVWPILGLGLLALIIIVERAIALRRVHTNAERLTTAVLDAVSHGEHDSALARCEDGGGAVSRVLAAGLGNRHLSRELLEDTLAESILNETARVERALPTLRVIAAVTPLLGLLGTVTGMISTFDVITEVGTGNPKLLSGGISEALITTELGLAVAIPVLLLHSFLAGRVDDIVSDMEKGGLRLTIALQREHDTGASPETHASAPGARG